MTNQTLSSLCLSKQTSLPPFLCTSGLQSLFLRSCLLNSFFSSAIFSSKNLHSLISMKSSFRRFLDTAIRIEGDITVARKYYYRNNKYEIGGNSGVVNFNECTFVECGGTGEGGAILMKNKNILKVESCTFVKCQAGVGAAIFAKPDDGSQYIETEFPIEINSCCFYELQNSETDSAIYLYAKVLKMSLSSFDKITCRNSQIYMFGEQPIFDSINVSNRMSTGHIFLEIRGSIWTENTMRNLNIIGNSGNYIFNIYYFSGNYVSKAITIDSVNVVGNTLYAWSDNNPGIFNSAKEGSNANQLVILKNLRIKNNIFSPNSPHVYRSGSSLMTITDSVIDFANPYGNDITFTGVTWGSKDVSTLIMNLYGQCPRVTDMFSQSVIMTESKHFEFTKMFSKTNKFYFSQIFSISKQFALSDKFSLSNGFSASKQVTYSKEFLSSSGFSSTKDFQDSKIFSNSVYLSSSNDFMASKKYSNSMIFIKTDPMSKTIKFSFTQEFIQSNRFIRTSSYTISNLFSKSNFYSKSNEFDTTKPLSCSEINSISNVFRKTESFSLSILFDLTKHFSLSDKYVSTQVMSNTDKMTKSEIFLDSNTFSNSAKMSETIEFKDSTVFSKSNKMVSTNKFNPTDLFSKTNIVIATKEFSVSSPVAENSLIQFSSEQTNEKQYEQSSLEKIIDISSMNILSERTNNHIVETSIINKPLTSIIHQEHSSFLDDYYISTQIEISLINTKPDSELRLNSDSTTSNLDYVSTSTEPSELEIIDKSSFITRKSFVYGNAESIESIEQSITKEEKTHSLNYSDNQFAETNGPIDSSQQNKQSQLVSHSTNSSISETNQYKYFTTVEKTDRKTLETQEYNELSHTTLTTSANEVSKENTNDDLGLNETQQEEINSLSESHYHFESVNENEVEEVTKNNKGGMIAGIIVGILIIIVVLLIYFLAIKKSKDSADGSISELDAENTIDYTNTNHSTMDGMLILDEDIRLYEDPSDYSHSYEEESILDIVDGMI